MEPHEDWVYESWSVDCDCGVNFDDGKEMVDCDECGVWVHTWCSRYVKGDDLFICHKCKIKKKDSEFSKLKVTKSLRMGNSSTQNETIPLKSCAEIPIEERVHVQGVPGGDLALFECVASVFTRQLWKCSGYVPKKFRFQYKEFPCWDDKENVCEIGHDKDTCTDVLFSMSKENDVDGKGINAREWGSREVEMNQSRCDINTEKSLLYPLSTSKRRQETQEAFEDRVNKKVKVTDKEEEVGIRRL